MKSDLNINPKIQMCPPPKESDHQNPFIKIHFELYYLGDLGDQTKKKQPTLICLCFFYAMTLTFLFQQKQVKTFILGDQLWIHPTFADVKTSNPGRECHHFR